MIVRDRSHTKGCVDERRPERSNENYKDRRFARMLEAGAVGEVEALLARKLDPTLPVMRAIGVPEIAAYLRGECTLDEVRRRGAQATRNYAKRQYTWFRRQPPAEWLRLTSFYIEIYSNFVSLFHD